MNQEDADGILDEIRRTNATKQMILRIISDYPKKSKKKRTGKGIPIRRIYEKLIRMHPGESEYEEGYRAGATALFELLEEVARRRS